MNSIGKAWKGGQGSALIYTALLAAVVSNFTPTPADAIYFRNLQKNKKLLDEGKITPKQYWTRSAVGYYNFTAAWYGMLLLAVSGYTGTPTQKLRFGLVLLSAGAVVAVVAKNIKLDEEIQKKKIMPI
jgi:hypothetical protein